MTTPPPRERMLEHIETLITHFLQVSWGPMLMRGGFVPDLIAHLGSINFVKADVDR